MANEGTERSTADALQQLIDYKNGKTLQPRLKVRPRHSRDVCFYTDAYHK